MSFFDEFMEKSKVVLSKTKDGAKKYSKVAVKKTGDMVNRTKLAYTADNTEDKIFSVMSEIGEIIYADYKDGKDLPEELLDKCAKIEELYTELDSLKTQIAELKSQVSCPSCGEYNAKNSDFCKNCGQNLKENQTEE